MFSLKTLRDSKELLSSSSEGNGRPSDEVQKLTKRLEEEFHKAMRDDLHTSSAIACFSEALKVMNDFLNTKKVKIPFLT